MSQETATATAANDITTAVMAIVTVKMECGRQLFRNLLKIIDEQPTREGKRAVIEEFWALRDIPKVSQSEECSCSEVTAQMNEQLIELAIATIPPTAKSPEHLAENGELDQALDQILSTLETATEKAPPELAQEFRAVVLESAFGESSVHRSTPAKPEKLNFESMAATIYANLDAYREFDAMLNADPSVETMTAFVAKMDVSPDVRAAFTLLLSKMSPTSSRRVRIAGIGIGGIGIGGVNLADILEHIRD